jgi:parvulin-like peptidyl-prolyl isomerase
MKTLETRPWGDPEHVVATVNGRPITRGDFYVRVLSRFGTAKLLAGILKEELFLQEAERRLLVASPAEVSAKVDEIVADMARDAGGETELEKIYEREGISLSDLRRDLVREVTTQLVIGKVTMAFRELDDDALRKYYQETYSKTRYRTRHIAYSFAPLPGQSEGDANRRRLEAFNKALRAADSIRKGADFATVARAESEDEVTASRGGDLGFIDQNSPMDPTLKKAILELPADGLSEPVENPAGGYHIFQVTEIVPSESYVDCLEKMRKEIQAKEPTLEEIEAVLMKLRERGAVRVFEFGDVPPVPARPGVDA